MVGDLIETSTQFSALTFKTQNTIKPKTKTFAPIDAKPAVNRKMAGSTLDGGMKLGGFKPKASARFSSM